MSQPRLLLTNDDGIDAPGLAALRAELTAVGNVTVVAPDEDQSGVGRTRNSVAVRCDHPWGCSLAGTPADCVAYGLRGLDIEFDLVVAGVNHGPNAGNYVVGRSGTVGAGIEAAFLGTPAIAVSAYHASDFYVHPPEEYDFDRPARVARDLVERSLSADVFSEADMLNVNAPVDVADPPVWLTRPYADYDQRIEHDPSDADSAVTEDLNPDEELVRLRDSVWPDVTGWENPFPPTEEYRDRYPEGSDRRALMDGAVGVSPLSVSYEAVHSDALADVVTAMDEISWE